MSEFTGGERLPFPHLVSDYTQVGEYATWPDDALERKFYEYATFLGQDDLMPRAKEIGQKVFLHLDFELGWRITDGLNGA